VAGIATGFDHGDVHSPLAHVGSGAVHQLGCDSASLARGIDGDHVHDAHAFVERAQLDGGESDGPLVVDRDEDIVVDTRATGSNRLGLNRSPVGLVETGKDRVTEDAAQRLENRLPGSQRELDDGVEVGFLERTDINLGGHAMVTVAGLRD
jgi:hypothetical protein